jgi:hypothetical protein
MSLLDQRIEYVQALLAERSEIDRKLEEALGIAPRTQEPVEVSARPKAERKGTRMYKCGSCGKPGHTAKKCPNTRTFSGVKFEGTDDSKSPADEDDLVRDIKRMWGEEELSSADVCSELGISLKELNSLILKHHITRQMV